MGRLPAIAALMTMARYENFSDNQAMKASSVGTIQADCLNQFTSKSKLQIAHEDIVKDVIEQHSLEAWTQPGSRLRQSPASRCTLLFMDRAPSTKPDEVAVSKAPTPLEEETATEEKIYQRMTSESWRQNAALSIEH